MLVVGVSVLGGYLRDSCCVFFFGWGSYGGVSVMVRMGWGVLLGSCLGVNGLGRFIYGLGELVLGLLS